MQNIEKGIRPLKPRCNLGKVMAFLRCERNLTIRDVSRLSHLSHAFVADLESGRRKASPKVLQSIGGGLQLSGNDQRWLYEAAANPQDPFVATGFLCPLATLAEQRAREEVCEVWVIDERPLEAESAEWAQATAMNLKRGCQYVYILPSLQIGRYVQSQLREMAGEDVVSRQVTCIAITDIPPMLFSPAKTFLLLDNSDPVLVFTFDVSPRCSRAPTHTMRQMFDFLDPIIRESRKKESITVPLGCISAPPNCFRL